MAVYLREKNSPAAFHEIWTTNENTKAKNSLFVEANEVGITKRIANAIIMTTNGISMSRV